MALIFGYKVLKLLLSAVNGEAPRKPLVRWVQINDVIAVTVITIHVKDRCPYDHVTELFIAFSTCDTPIFCHICF